MAERRTKCRSGNGNPVKHYGTADQNSYSSDRKSVYKDYLRYHKEDREGIEMAIERTVETNVYCDICGEWIMGWRSNDTGVSKVWASYYASKKRLYSRQKRSPVKNCRIQKSISDM